MKDIPKEMLEILDELSSQELRLFACDCAEHVLPYFEKPMPGDNRPREAIEVSRRYAYGEASADELKKAASESEGAAWGEEIIKFDEDKFLPSDLDAIAPAAATAEMCCKIDPMVAVKATVKTAIEVVVTAAVGIEKAALVWGNRGDVVDYEILHRYQEAERSEFLWQLDRCRKYAEK